jgi:hypothetical protein
VNSGAGGGAGWVGGTVTGPTGGGILIGGFGCGAGCGGGVVQAASKATTVNKAGTLRRVENIWDDNGMWILMLEAGTALFLLVFIVWWTMFSGRKPEQPPSTRKNDTPDA